MKRILLKLAKIVGATLVSLLVLMIAVPMIFSDAISDKIKSLANSQLNGEMDFSRARLSFFTYFPSLTVTFYDFTLIGAHPFETDTLLAAKRIGAGINVKKLLFRGEQHIDKLFISDGFINVKVSTEGKANYNIYKAGAAKKDSPRESKDSISSASFNLERVDIVNTRVRYHDQSAKILVDARGVRFIGQGDLSKAVFNLSTWVSIDFFDLYLNDKVFLKSKHIQADLLTNINTHSLSFLFKKNTLKINSLPIMFNGRLDILKEGYDVDVLVATTKSKLSDFLGAFPPKYVEWLSRTTLSGMISSQLTFKGNYNVALKHKPDLTLGVSIGDGFIRHGVSTSAVTGLNLGLKVALPSLSLDSLAVDVDTLAFNVGANTISASFSSKGFVDPRINALVRGKVDLGALNRALGLSIIEVEGLLDTDIRMDGVFSPKNKYLPVTKAKVSIHDGQLKTPYYPNPITAINITAGITTLSGKFEDVKLEVTPLSFLFEENPFSLSTILSNLEDISYDIQVKGEADLEKISKVFSPKDLEVVGYVKADLALKGRKTDALNGAYSKLDSKGSLQLKNIKASTAYFPHPFFIKEGIFSFYQDRMQFDSFSVAYGKSDFSVKGYMQNVVGYFFSKSKVIEGSFSVTSKLVNVDEFMALEGVGSGKQLKEVEELKKKNSQESGVVLVPPNLNVKLHADAARVHFNGLNLDDFSGDLLIKNGVATLSKVGFGLVGCDVLMDATYKDNGPLNANFDFHLQTKNFDVKKAYNEVSLFRELVSVAENAEGIISVDYSLSGMLDGNMSPVLSSLVGSGVISVSHVKVSGFKIFSAIGRETKSDGLEDADVSKVDIRTSIRNRVIKVERFRFRTSVFRIRFEGESSLDGRISFRVRLGLPPLGVLGIPIVVNGTYDDPQIRVFRTTIKDLDDGEEQQ